MKWQEQTKTVAMDGPNKQRVQTAVGKVFEDPKTDDQPNKVTQA